MSEVCIYITDGGGGPVADGGGYMEGSCYLRGKYKERPFLSAE